MGYPHPCDEYLTLDVEVVETKSTQYLTDLSGLFDGCELVLTAQREAVTYDFNVVGICVGVHFDEAEPLEVRIPLPTTEVEVVTDVACVDGEIVATFDDITALDCTVV